MASVNGAEPAAIRDHYDRLSIFYRSLWGDHIHHGYWENGDESPAAAQLKLVERLAARAHIPPGANVLDVGCGLGASALWLAENLGCSVLGLTISRVQAAMATETALAKGLGRKLRFEVADANHLDVPDSTFGAVWVIECSEHLDDKEGFIRACARVLKPRGVLALCAWLRVDEPRPDQGRLISAICEGMLCPSLASMRDYVHWMRMAHLDEIEAEDVTRRVEETWTRCALLASRPDVRAMLRFASRKIRRFVETFGTMGRAYAEGAMAYGMLTARKPW